MSEITKDSLRALCTHGRALFAYLGIIIRAERNYQTGAYDRSDSTLKDTPEVRAVPKRRPHGVQLWNAVCDKIQTELIGVCIQNKNRFLIIDFWQLIFDFRFTRERSLTKIDYDYENRFLDFWKSCITWESIQLSMYVYRTGSCSKAKPSYYEFEWCASMQCSKACQILRIRLEVLLQERQVSIARTEPLIY